MDSSSENKILAELARAVWRRDHSNKPCPSNLLGSLTPESVAEYLPEPECATLACLRPEQLASTPSVRREWASLPCLPISRQRKRRIVALYSGRSVDPMLHRIITTDVSGDWAGEWGAISTGYSNYVWASLKLIHAAWKQLPEKDKRAGHPAADLVRERLNRPRPVNQAHISAVQRKPLTLTKWPGYASAALLCPGIELEGIMVDGEPVATASPGETRFFRQITKPAQGEFWPAPRTIGGQDLGDMLISSLAGFRFDDDERSPLRSDIVRLALLAYAVASNGVTFLEADGVYFLTGYHRLTNDNRRRWWRATEALRCLTFTINPKTREWAEMARVTRLEDSCVAIQPPAWWMVANRAWRVSGGLFLPPHLGKSNERGLAVGHWGGLHRCIQGIEGALSWGPPAGRRRDGRIPDALRPARGPGSAGQEVFLRWDHVIRLAGEPVVGGPRDSCGRRYRRRIDALKEIGFEVGGRREAEAGHTWEIVRQVRGTKVREPGIIARASARFVEAYKRGQKEANWELIPVQSLLPLQTD